VIGRTKYEGEGEREKRREGRRDGPPLMKIGIYG
jgi:hypothetical protein